MMMRDRRCLLCETVCVSKQEMDEHMRSMLHHRELEKLKGRDCGHECRVCQVKVSSLTDYASHISSPMHKQNVEAADKLHAGSNKDENYFDQELVDLIEKKNKQIRKEKEAAAAAKLAKEEEKQQKQRKEEFHQRLKEVKERYRLECVCQPPSQGFNGSSQSWQRRSYGQTSPEGPRPQPWLHNSKQEKSATWHAQHPPNLYRWVSGEFPGGRNEGLVGRSNKTWGYGGNYGNQQSRLPWLSSEGSSYGLYGHNNISRYAQKAQYQNFLGSPPFQTSPSFHPRTFNQFQSSVQNKRHQQSAGPRHEAPQPESDQGGSQNSKGFGSNPKLDKGCRWTPYPVTSGPHSETHSNTTEKNHRTPKAQHQEVSGSNKHKAGLLSSGRQGEEERLKPKPSFGDRSCNGTKGISSHPGSGSSSQRTDKPLLHVDQKNSCGPGARTGAQHIKAFGPNPPQCKPPGKQSGPRESIGSLQTRQERRSSADCGLKMTHHTEEQMDQGHNQTQTVSPPVTHRPEKPAPPSSDSTKSVQPLQVSTSSSENMEPTASARSNEEKREKPEQETTSVSPEEAMQVTEAGQGSESDTSRNREAQNLSESNSSTLSKLDLFPVLKRDLTKHISSKSKPAGHEPNLNIARRVRNLSESRRSDSEKESGLKPTVMQLISSSGPRRNVNWDQVYQEVKKKQDKGKGKPRFGIEMVSYEQECQSQEEGDIPILEAFQWELLNDDSSEGNSMKGSLSESSVTPASTHRLFASIPSEETTCRDGLSSEQLRPTASPSSFAAQEKPHPCQPEAMVQKQPDRLTSATAKVLSPSDLVLGDSSSGMEQCDGQGPGKRRRAAGDPTHKEAFSLEHNSKRRKVKSKRERVQIDQLLAVSLREEELSRSLQNVDTSLIAARAALEAAYKEVQRLMVVKQQVTVEMSSLRSQRIELLKGMQGSVEEEAPQVKLKEEKMDFCEMEPSLMSSSVTRSAALDSASPTQAVEATSPPSSDLPLSVVIKEEPQSPVHVSSEPSSSTTCWAHSSLELPVGATILPENCGFQSSPDKQLESNQTSSAEPADCRETLSELVETTQAATQTLSNSTIFVEPRSPSGGDSGAGSVADCADFQMMQPPSALNVPASPSELRSGKRVRKLKKRKALKKAQVTEQPESSDTEMDGEALRPRWRLRRRPSGGSQVSTSSQPTDDREVNTDGSKKTLFPDRKLEKDQKLPKQMVELPQAAAVGPVGSFDLEEHMEITAACQQHQEDISVPDPSLALVPGFWSPELQGQAFNKVSSTSDMDLCKSSESDLPFAIALPKNSSDAFSDHIEDEIPTEGVFDGHQEAVNALQIHNGLLYTCSGDRTVKAFDLVSHECVGVFEGHSSKVTCLLVSSAPCLNHRLYSGSSDQTICCYSLKTHELEQQFPLPDRVLCLHSRWKTLYAGLANGTVVTFNLRTNKQMDVFECHRPRGVSCLSSSQEGAQRILLVGSYDNTISVRVAKNGLLLRTLKGHTKSILCMTVVNDLVFSGSSDHSVYAHSIHTGELVRVYKGHSHAVTVVTVLGKVMVTACLDKLVRVYDLQSQDQLQVYAGHRDMVLCMSVHKNMIYTGCYDGSVQAVKLNLMQNHRCWWYGCSLVFGMTEHLQQHLMNDHAGANFQTLKCHWRKCEEFFCVRSSSKQVLLLHMQKHAEEQGGP